MDFVNQRVSENAATPFTTVMARVAAAEMAVLDLLARVPWLTVTQLAAEIELDQWVVRWAVIRLGTQRLIERRGGPDTDAWRITWRGKAFLKQIARDLEPRGRT
ncbi:putative transcriptional regulator [Nocardia transvalensis]|uniref:Putative transcriptional regulator n=1 Tax=Nocardia transvalensis TaxID=37333 RepID=A0A7W9PG27_9NOCA|nr:hypothetical protein [Nocardia transvalensis]MBB5915536.1 putative transcriptional regulator [Nocardia transvalensis]